MIPFAQACAGGASDGWLQSVTGVAHALVEIARKKPDVTRELHPA
jgi:hypothetical protein